MAYIEQRRPGQSDMNTGGAQSQPNKGRTGLSNGNATQTPRPSPNRTHPGIMGSVPFGQTAEGRLHGMLGRGSAYMDAAKRTAKEQMAARGLTDSSMAVGAAHRAAVQSAAPFAMQDAQMLQRERLTQQGMKHQADQARMQRQFQGRQAGLQRGFLAGQQAQQRAFASQMDAARRGWQTGEREAAQRWRADEMQDQRRWQSGQADLQRNFAANQAALGRIFQGEQAAAGRELSRELAQLQVNANKYAVDKNFMANMMNSFSNIIGNMAASGQYSSSALQGYARGMIGQFNAMYNWFASLGFGPGR